MGKSGQVGFSVVDTDGWEPPGVARGLVLLVAVVICCCCEAMEAMEELSVNPTATPLEETIEDTYFTEFVAPPVILGIFVLFVMLFVPEALIFGILPPPEMVCV